MKGAIYPKADRKKHFRLQRSLNYRDETIFKIPRAFFSKLYLSVKEM